ncbi:uncharacterized protein PHALS_06347 [Plasmopara halstedii]|uniref:Uncharacterized protein n=1 Tax=Plasmopara halstedii TaxID=4781 RepID=A0A0P1B3R8_PLAHL|nr:uncharacterized protein PHALS_06347 [Plasmopara halstedii]CEG48529.1 hypothetical protein PHALS_06347 [Plasmopara halstedii]|eukprot:XP_024584898.1 hypothetical protein PHALS_06347 [Plasmopara halstedii]
MHRCVEDAVTLLIVTSVDNQDTTWPNVPKEDDIKEINIMESKHQHPPINTKIVQDNGNEDSEEVVMFAAQEIMFVKKKSPSNQLMTVNEKINDKSVRILIVSGATNDLYRPKLTANVIGKKEVFIEGIDGRSTPRRVVNEVQTVVTFEGWKFADQVLTEWDL